MRPPSASLIARYAEPHRRYHTLDHIRQCLALLNAEPGVDADERRLIERAIWWHDAIYDPRRSDNEERSAELAETELETLGASPADREEVARLIRLTTGHRVEPGDRSGALLVSIDLAILGAPPDEYDAYAAAIRQEYAHVPEAAFRAGRAAILRRLLEEAAIYPDEGFRRRYEASARSNLARELDRLSAPPAG